MAMVLTLLEQRAASPCGGALLPRMEGQLCCGVMAPYRSVGGGRRRTAIVTCCTNRGTPLAAAQDSPSMQRQLAASIPSGRLDSEAERVQNTWHRLLR